MTADIYTDPLNQEINNIINVCNSSLEARLKDAILNNMFSKVSIYTYGEAFSCATVDGDIVVTDNRHLNIAHTKNIITVVRNFLYNLYMLIKAGQFVS